MSVVSETGHSLQTNFAVKSACEFDKHKPNLMGEEGPCSCPPMVLEAGPLPGACPQPLGFDTLGLPRLWLGSEVRGPAATWQPPSPLPPGESSAASPSLPHHPSFPSLLCLSQRAVTAALDYKVVSGVLPAQHCQGHVQHISS